MTSLKKYSVKWDMEAKKQLRFIFDRIKHTSPNNAKFVKPKSWKPREVYQLCLRGMKCTRQ